MPKKLPTKKLKHEKKAAGELAPDLTVEDWDFSDCPAEQLEYCCYYEYARESDGTKERVALLRNRQLPTGLYPGDWEYYQLKWFSEFFSALEQFPETPWLRVSKKTREAVVSKCSTLEGPFMTVDPERVSLERDAPYPYEPADVGVLALHTVYTVEVDWTASDDEIFRKFKAWLAESRPTDELVFEKRGRTADGELLKFLGTLRLLRAFGDDWRKAQDWAQEHGRGKWTPSYSDQSGWLRACKKARNAIAPGTVLTPLASLIKKLDETELDRREKAKAKVLIALAERAEQRRLIGLEKQKGIQAVLAQFIEAHKSQP